jgi:drug/metabolite transporter (DMT)-like permease
VPPIGLSFYRWSVATLILLPFSVNGFIKEWHIVKKNLHYFFWLSLTGISLFNTFVYVAGHYTSAINLALIGTTSSPIMAVILARIFLKEKIGLLKVVGMVICVAGILYLLSRGDFQNLLHLKFSRGDAWALLAGFSFAVYNTLVRKKPHEMSPVSFLFTAVGFGTLMLLPFFIWEMGHSQPVVWDLNFAGVLLYLGLGTSVISFFIWNKSIRILGAGRTALFGNLIPVFSSLEAVLILGEDFTIHHIISMIVVFTGLFIANLALFRKTAP